MSNLFVLHAVHPVHGKVAHPIMLNAQSVLLSEIWHNFREVFLMHRYGGFGHCRGELVEGEFSPLMEEFHLWEMETFQSADGSRLGCVWDRRGRGGHYKVDDRNGNSVRVRCRLWIKLWTRLNKMVLGWRGMGG